MRKVVPVLKACLIEWEMGFLEIVSPILVKRNQDRQSVHREIVIQVSWSFDGYPFISRPLSPEKCFDKPFVLSVQVHLLGLTSLIVKQTYAPLHVSSLLRQFKLSSVLSLSWRLFHMIRKPSDGTAFDVEIFPTSVRY